MDNDSPRSVPMTLNEDKTALRPMTYGERASIARATAEHIVADLIPEHDRLASLPEVTIHYASDDRPPRTVPEITRCLIEGDVWTSWLDEHVFMALRALHPGKSL